MLRKFIYWLIPALLVMVTSVSQGEIKGSIPNIDAGYALQKSGQPLFMRQLFSSLNIL